MVTTQQSQFITHPGSPQFTQFSPPFYNLPPPAGPPFPTQILLPYDAPISVPPSLPSTQNKPGLPRGTERKYHGTTSTKQTTPTDNDKPKRTNNRNKPSCSPSTRNHWRDPSIIPATLCKLPDAPNWQCLAHNRTRATQPPTCPDPTMHSRNNHRDGGATSTFWPDNYRPR